MKRGSAVVRGLKEAALHACALMCVGGGAAWASAHNLLATDVRQRWLGFVLCAASLGLSRVRMRVAAGALARAFAFFGQVLALLGAADVAPHVVVSLATVGIPLGLAFAVLSADPFERAVGAMGASFAAFAWVAGTPALPLLIAAALVAGARLPERVLGLDTRAWISGIALAGMAALWVWPQALSGPWGMLLGLAVLAGFGTAALPAAVLALIVAPFGAGALGVAGAVGLALAHRGELRALGIASCGALVFFAFAALSSLPGSAPLHLAALCACGLALKFAEHRLPGSQVFLRYWSHGRTLLGHVARGGGAPVLGGDAARPGPKMG